MIDKFVMHETSELPFAITSRFDPDYHDETFSRCPYCERTRITLSICRLLSCEKCGWCVEEARFITDDDLDGSVNDFNDE